MRLALVLLCLARVHFGSPANVQVVVSLCKEKRLHFLRTILETVLSGHNTSLKAYAKCGPHEAFPEAELLPNVGREGHTYWLHMQRLLGALRRRVHPPSELTRAPRSSRAGGVGA